MKSAENSMQLISCLKDYFECWKNAGREKFFVESSNRIVSVVYMAALINVCTLTYVIDYYANHICIKELISYRGNIPLKQKILLWLVYYKCSWIIYLIIRIKEIFNNR